MKLHDLEAEFVKIVDEHATLNVHGATLAQAAGVRNMEMMTRKDVTLDVAQGLWFLCPKCYATNSGPVGTHVVLVWFVNRGVPDERSPGPGRWIPSGTSIYDLSLSPSINLDVGPEPRGCRWHGFVTNGDAT